MGTLRQQIMARLKIQPMDRRQLSQTLGISEKEADRHLPHVAKSAVARGMIWTVRPAICENCSYIFKNRQRLDPPGRCPACRQSRIRGPWYQIT